MKEITKKLPQSNVPKPAPTTCAEPPSETVNKEPVISKTTQLSEPNAPETPETHAVRQSSETINKVEPLSSEDKPELPEFLIALLKEIAEKEGFKEYTLEVSAGSNHGDGFLAIVKRVTLTGVRNGVQDKLSLMCKLMPVSQARREQFNSDAVFIREAFMYREVLPTFVEFQKEKGLSKEDGFYEYPKCYGTMDDTVNDHFVIIMEDLKSFGYQMYDKFKSADFNHVKLFVESLGKFHAISFALKDQRPEVFGKFKHLKDVFIQQVEEKPEVMGPMFSFFFDKAIAAFKPEDEVEIKALTKLKENIVDEIMRTGSGENSEPFTIINHGDCWNNNLMYRYGKEVVK